MRRVSELDVPPATAPGNVNQSPDLGLVRMDGYGDMRFGMTADEARQAWGGELKGAGDEEAACYYLTPQWVDIPSNFALRSDEHTSELQSLMRTSYAVFCLKYKKKT